jgi:hypothetical protein
MADSVAWVFLNTTRTSPTAHNDAVDFTTLCGEADIQLTTTLRATTPFAGPALTLLVRARRQIPDLDIVTPGGAGI